eukprot:scaffold1307_cov200-Pinguiococcus_pyrenoidosus.AAC.23
MSRSTHEGTAIRYPSTKYQIRVLRRGECLGKALKAPQSASSRRSLLLGAMGEDLDPSAAGKRIKAYKIAVEYRYMKAHAPGGTEAI